MDPLERALLSCVQRGTASALSPRLTEAVHHAVFPGGARVRPRIALAVARGIRGAGAGSDEAPSELAYAVAAAVELLHCATLVHDDLPCFDDAATRRGRPSVHAAFGVPTALLVGDGLIVLAFEAMAAAGGPASAGRIVAAVGELGRAAGSTRRGSRRSTPAAGSFSSRGTKGKTQPLRGRGGARGDRRRGDASPYRAFGGRRRAHRCGRRPWTPSARAARRPGKDAEHARPSAVAELGLDGAVAAFEASARGAQDAATACPCGGVTLVPELDALIVRLRRAAGIAWDSATRQG